MILKKDKETVLSEINSRVDAAIHNDLQNAFGPGLRLDTHSLIYTLKSAIASGVEEGFRVLLENRYTDDDFEKDLTLKP